MSEKELIEYSTNYEITKNDSTYTINSKNSNLSAKVYVNDRTDYFISGMPNNNGIEIDMEELSKLQFLCANLLYEIEADKLFKEYKEN